MALLRTQQLINGYTGRQTFGSLHQHSARSWTQTLMLGKVSAIWFTCWGSRYGRTSENHPVFFIWFVWYLKKKRLGHCYDAIYTLLYLLLSPNNLLRLKKTSESNHLLSLQNNYSEWKINLLPERIEPVKAFMIILFFPSPFLNEWYYYQLVGVVGWRSLKGLMFPLHVFVLHESHSPEEYLQWKEELIPFAVTKNHNVHLEFYHAAQKVSIGNYLSWQSFDLSRMNSSQSFFFF